jgi:hypothetical protein
MKVHERFRIHHGIGSRVLLDSDQGALRFTYERQPTGGLFQVFTERTPAIEEVLRLKDEINVFIFKEQDGVAVEKVWFYTGDGQVDYNEEDQCLIIRASSHIAYRPDDFQQA